MFTGKEVSLQEMLDCRERRANLQKQYYLKYQKLIISFCMNTPGPIKTSPQIRQAFDIGCQEIQSVLAKEKILFLDSITLYERTGDEWILCIDSSASHIKDLMMQIENSHPLGRLFDIDVIDQQGKKLSRSTFRKCLICSAQAQECARSRKHSVAEMQKQILTILNENLP